MERAEIVFEGAAPADVTRLAVALAEFITAHVDGARAEVTGSSPDEMDFGGTVALLLGTNAIVALARGLADWVRRQGDPDLVIKTRKGSVTLKGGLDAQAKREIILAAFEKGVV